MHSACVWVQINSLMVLPLLTSVSLVNTISYNNNELGWHDWFSDCEKARFIACKHVTRRNCRGKEARNNLYYLPC